MLVISCAISTAVRLNSDLLVTSLESDKGFQWYGMCFDLISFRKTGMNFHDSQNNVKQCETACKTLACFVVSPKFVVP